MPFLKNVRLSAFPGVAVCVLNGFGITPFVKPEEQFHRAGAGERNVTCPTR